MRTPLAPIAGWASVLRTAQNLQRVQQAADAIERNAFLQSRMIDDLLDVTRIAHGTIALEREPLDLSACVRAVLEALGPDIEKKAIRVDLAGAGGRLFVKGDADRLQQVFANILSNAVKFTPSGGSIRVALGRDASAARIVVTDTGRGIAPDFLPFAFELFRQQESGTRREYAGLGIGLALVKKLTELQDGTVTISSAGEGRGTEVAVQFPLVAEPVEADATPAVERPGPTSLAGISMLVVDDVQDAREILQVLLQHLGAQVESAAGGREALG